MAWDRARSGNCGKRSGKRVAVSRKTDLTMAANKTKPTRQSVAAFLKDKAGAAQLADCRKLLALFKELTGKPARMWGPSIVGFGAYHYVYPSGREGDAPLIGFSPRGREIVLYLCPYPQAKPLLKKLGPHKAGAGCVYIRSLEEVDQGVLKKLARASIGELRGRYPNRKAG
jgi:hypothetical protein